MNQIDKTAAIEHYREILRLLGQDVSREGLLDTPKRYVSFLEEFLRPAEFTFTTFDAEDMQNMVDECNIAFWSLCEHHTLPFFGVAHVGYIPYHRIAGLSKIPRTVKMVSRRLQNQERITQQIAEYLQEKLNPIGVGVILDARHSCMECRGAEAGNVSTSTTALLGAFKKDPTVRAEFMATVARKARSSY